LAESIAGLSAPTADRVDVHRHIGGQKIRILFVSDSIREPATGVGRMALTLLRELVAQGHQVVPVDHRENPIAAAVAGRCEVLPLRLRWAQTARWHFSLLRRLPQLAVEHDVLLNPTGYPNVRGHHPRLALVIHDLHMLQPGCYRPFKRTWFRMFFGRGLRNARLAICVSEHTRSELLRNYPMDPERCVVVHNSLDPAFTGDEMADGSAGDGSAGGGPVEGAVTQTRGPYFLVVGTIEERKNVLRLAEAFARCREAGLTTRLVVAGRPGHGSEAFLRRIKAPDLEGAVEVLGGVADRELCGLYRGAVGLLFPSLEEGFGLPILEAMQTGTPILTSRVSATAEVAGDAALLVDPSDTDSIEAGIMRLGQDQTLRATLRRRGLRRVQRFGAGAQAAAYVDHLEALVGAGTTGTGSGAEA
jgi:glycosyltransferase involved in cell wall biosynthesis